MRHWRNESFRPRYSLFGFQCRFETLEFGSASPQPLWDCDASGGQRAAAAAGRRSGCARCRCCRAGSSPAILPNPRPKVSVASGKKRPRGIAREHRARSDPAIDREGRPATRQVPDYRLPPWTADPASHFIAKAKASGAHVHEIRSADEVPASIWAIMTEPGFLRICTLREFATQRACLGTRARVGSSRFRPTEMTAQRPRPITNRRDRHARLPLRTAQPLVLAFSAGLRIRAHDARGIFAALRRYCRSSCYRASDCRQRSIS